MVWQDIVISIATLIFGISAANQVYYGFKEKKGFITVFTSVTMVIAYLIMFVSYFTINLYYSATMVAINGTMWLIMFFQRMIYKKP